MPGEKAQNLQDSFLNHVRKHKVPVTIFLVNGVKLQGVITWFDNFCLLLRRDAQSQLVYKHAISTITLPATNSGWRTIEMAWCNPTAPSTRWCGVAALIVAARAELR